MKTLWFITNPGSGSTTEAKCAALEAVFAELGLTLAGSTHVPDQPLPEAAALDAAGVDTVVLFAGDGTINAALCALADWKGDFLILPGGTMNLLAKALHDEADPAAIVRAAHDGPGRRVAMPFVVAGQHRAFVGLILGPAAAWARAREAARKGRVASSIRAIRTAWAASFGKRGIRVRGAPGLAQRYQAIFVFPHADGLEAAAVDARDWGSLAGLGWDWLTGDWVAGRAVTTAHASELRLAGRRKVLALFDGEQVLLDPATRIRAGLSRKSFIATRKEDS